MFYSLLHGRFQQGQRIHFHRRGSEEGGGDDCDPVSPISELSFTPSEGETTPYAAEIILDILDNLAASSNENNDNTKECKEPRKKG